MNTTSAPDSTDGGNWIVSEWAGYCGPYSTTVGI